MTHIATGLFVIVAAILVSCASTDTPGVEAKRPAAKSEKLTAMISTARKEDIIPIPTREVPATKAKAEKGDIDAINKLIGYYLRHDQDAEAQKWSARRDEILSKRHGQ
jgi:hypothetical protein